MPRRRVFRQADRIFVPDGWLYEKSLSAKHRFVEAEELSKSLQFVRSETGVDVYRDRETGRELYIGRSPTARP
jgi:hypothetical protein